MTPKEKTPGSARRKSSQEQPGSLQSGRSSGRKRSNTYTLAEGTVPSPTVKEMMDSLKDGMTKEELKDSLQNVLNKNSKTAGTSFLLRIIVRHTEFGCA